MIHQNTPEKWIPKPKRMEKFLSECSGDFGTEDCVFWGTNQDRLVTVKVHDQEITTKRDLNMYFWLNGKLRNVKAITFAWCYGFESEKKTFKNTCRNRDCINPCHLTIQQVNASILTNSETKFKSDRNEHILEAMRMIHVDTPSMYTPDYLTFVKFVSNCKGGWGDKEKCIYWSGPDKKFAINSEKITPKKLCYLWRFGESPSRIKKQHKLCWDPKCINMYHFKDPALLQRKKRKVE